MAEKKIQAIIIVEVAGRPGNFVREGLETHVSRINQMQDIEVISKTFSEPKKIEHAEEAFVCFSEIEVRVSTFQRLLDLVFDFMPSSIEIVDPGKVEMNSQEATMFVNNLAGRLHRYDEIAKIAQFKIKQLSDELALIKKGQEKEEKKEILGPSEKKERETKKKKVKSSV